jgi:hypothetical protein
MMDYLVRFVGHIDETRRPDGFPKAVYSDLYVRADNPSGLKSAINEQAVVYIRDGCMIVPRNPDAIEEFAGASVPPDSRMIVPLHMFTHLTTITKRITGEIPQLDADNKPQVTDGSKVVIQ